MGLHPSHVARYDFAKKYTSEMTVLDVGCADGFGVSMMVQNAKKVVGIDNDKTLIVCAKEKYKSLKNAEFIIGDARRLPFPDNSFDVAVSFEIIEHLINQKNFLLELNRVVKRGGTVIISTPDHNANQKIGIYQPRHEGHGHPSELTFEQFFYLMNQYFDHLEFYGQFPYRDPSFKDRVVNAIKQIDFLNLRKLIPRKLRDKNNLSVYVYEQDFSIKKLIEPMVQILSIGINKK